MTASGRRIRGAWPGRVPDAGKIRVEALKLAQHLVALENESLRSAAAARHLQNRSPAEVVLIVSELAHRARDNATAATAVATIARALAQELIDAEHIAVCLQAARSRADRAVEAIFATGPALRDYDRNDETFVDKRLNAMPLGRRRSLSRSKDIDLLTRLAHDQDPEVIKQLLANPRVTEREALVVASRRPTRPAILEQVLIGRFGVRARIKAAVAHNPYAPLTLAVRAMTGLSAVELLALAADDKLAPEVRRHARSLLILRRPTPAERNRPARTPTNDAQTRSALDTLLRQLASDEEDEELQLITD